MPILVVAATDEEVAPLVGGLRENAGHAARLTRYQFADHDVHVLVTGVGMVATAAWCSRVLSDGSYSLAFNVGVCGSFDRALEPGCVVHTVSDRIAELGAEDDESFLTIDDLKLVGRDATAYARSELVNPSPPINSALSELPRVTGITVNTVHGSERSIAEVVQRFRPQVETMEGAAFMYACMIHEVPFAQVRAVSNVVEKRNRSAWRLREAIDSLGVTTLKILEAV